MNELKLIKLLYNNIYYNKYNKYIKDILSNNKELLIIFNAISKLHEKYHRDLDHLEVALYILVNCLDKDKDVLSDLLNQIKDLQIDNSSFEDILNTVVKRKHAYDLALLALEVSEGRKEYEDLVTQTKQLDSKPTYAELEDSIVTKELDELYDSTTATVGLRWRLDTLNKMLGSLRRGNFGIIFARPETGKTTFLTSELSYFARQLRDQSSDTDTKPGPILWFNNEETGDNVKIRLYQAVLGLTREELFNDINGNKQAYMEHGGGFITLVDNAAIHRHQVEILCEKYKPSCIVFDQLDKIKGFVGDREDLRLGAIYIWAREIAKQYCPVLAVCQADVSGEGKKWLTMDNVANAKTAKQAEADFILGIGKTHNVTEEYMRFFHLSKNKLPGDLDTEPDLRHGQKTVRIAADIARYEDL